MWSPKLFRQETVEEVPATPRIPPVPLRLHTPRFSDAVVGSRVRFSEACPLPQLAGKLASVHSLRHYRFGDDAITSFRLQLGQNTSFSLSVAQDDQGQYLAISRQLGAQEQDHWFGADALGFFTEPSTAKTLRCKVDLASEGAWAAARYVKTVDWIDGTLSDGRQQTGFNYTMLMNEDGDKSLEIEHYPALEKNKVYVTVYRPMEDVSAILDPAEAPSLPSLTRASPPPTPPKPQVRPIPVFDVPPRVPIRPSVEPKLPLEAPPAAAPQSEVPQQVRSRTDFRRAGEEGEAIHIHPTPHAPATLPQSEDTAPLPAFLLTREHSYVSLDDMIAPDHERVRCGLLAAKQLIDHALARGVRVRDVLRETVGLDSALADEVVFEMPLSDADYRQLAMRYKLRPDHREEIRARLQRDLQNKLLGMGE